MLDADRNSVAVEWRETVIRHIVFGPRFLSQLTFKRGRPQRSRGECHTLHAMPMFILPLDRTTKAFAILSLRWPVSRLLCGIRINAMVSVRLSYTYTVYVHGTEESFYPTARGLVAYTVYDTNTCRAHIETVRDGIASKEIKFRNRLLSTVAKAAEPSFKFFVPHHCCCVCRVSRIADILLILRVNNKIKTKKKKNR